MRNSDRNVYSSDKELSQYSAIKTLDLCNKLIEHLRKIDKKKKLENILISFNEMVRIHEPFTPNQLSLIDGIYEATMKGLNLPSVAPHIDKKKKGLRY